MYEIFKDKEWRNRVDNKREEFFSQYPKLKELAIVLESKFEGTLFNPCFETEDELNSMLEKGRFFKETYKVIKGEVSQCHRNSCILYLTQNKEFAKKYGYKEKLNKEFNIGSVSIYTGYALSEDGLWRQHTWVVTNKDSIHGEQVIETTEDRIAYYGYHVKGLELEDFIEENY